MSADLSTKDRVYQAALDAFIEKGYAGASLRDIARRVGIEVASLYNHMSSKEELLFEILRQGNTAMIEALDEALADTPPDAQGDPDPRARLMSLVRSSVEFAALHRRYRIVAGRAELGSLSPAHLDVVMAQREGIEDRFKGVVQECVSAGLLPDSVPVTVLAYLMMAPSTSVRGWFDDGGALGADEVAEIAAQLVVDGLSDRT